MINKNEFYDNSDHPGRERKERIWNNVQGELKEYQNQSSFFEIRSFSFGFVTAIVFLFFMIGVYTVASQVFTKHEPIEIKINDAYLSAISQIEKNLPESVPGESNEVMIDEFIDVKKEELKEIDVAIGLYRMQSNRNDYSKVKMEKLRELYKTKLEILESLIELGGE